MDPKKLGSEAAILIAGLSDLYHGQISAYIQAHPQVSMALAFLFILLSKFQQSPIPPKG